MSKIDQIEEVLNVLKDIDGLKRERIDLIAENDGKRTANAKLEQAERAAEAANRHARALIEKTDADALAKLTEAKAKAEAIVEAAQIQADELVQRATESSQATINATRAQLAGEREAVECAKLEKGVLESEIKALQAKHDQLAAALDALKAVAKGL